MDVLIKNNIIKNIENFEPVILVKTMDPSKTIEDILIENPKLAFYISSIRPESRTFDIIQGVKLKVDYINTDIPKDLVFIVKTEDELQRVFHKVISESQLKIGIVSDKVDADKVYWDFHGVYQLYYSNLVNTQSSHMQFSFLPFTYYIFDFSYRIGRVKLNMMRREVEDKIKELDKKLFAPSMTGIEIAYIAHNYLARTVDYWVIDDPNPLELSYRQSAYGALINKKCVCQGYAEAFKKILNYKGVSCEVVSGKIKGENSYHAWNVLTINNLNNFHIDVTWDSLGGGKKRDDYFGLMDKDLTSTRMWTRPFGIVCVSSINLAKMAKERIARSRDKYIRYGVDAKYLD